MNYTHTVKIYDQAILINDNEYWLEGSVDVTGLLENDVSYFECHGVPKWLPQYTWQIKELEVYEMNLVELDENGQETEIYDESIKSIAKHILKDLAAQKSSEDFEL